MSQISPRGAAPLHRLELLLGAEFVIALVLLAVNDFVLKEAFPGWVSGKLSDFAGLFAFTVFLIALWPRRGGAIAVAVALAFAFWKSSLSDGLLAVWNDHGPLALARVTDATDLIALSVLPFAVMYSRRVMRWQMPRRARHVVLLLSVILFTATSAAPETRRDGTVHDIPLAGPEVVRRIALADSADESFSLGIRHSGESVDTMRVFIQRVAYVLEVRATSPETARLTVLEIVADQGTWDNDVSRTRPLFLAAVIDPLRRP